MKHITLEYMEIPEFDAVVFRVAEQTHRENGFGVDGKDVFEAFNGITLLSCACPCASDKLLFLRGKEREDDNLVFVVPKAQFVEYAEAIREYNVHFADDPAPVCGGSSRIKVVE